MVYEYVVDKKYDNIGAKITHLSYEHIDWNIVCRHLNKKHGCDICLKLNSLEGIKNNINDLTTSIYELKKSIDNLNKK
jgi:hypothetical protein